MTDRLGNPLAATVTRRQVLRTALAGAALTLPFARGALPTARAAGPNDCRKGCNWTADRAFKSQDTRCADSFAYSLLVGVAFPFYIYPAIFGGGTKVVACIDRNFLTHKANLYDCLQPNCPGFDPKAPDGPCDGCRDNCCTCQASPNGYICCIFTCEDQEHNCCPT